MTDKLYLQGVRPYENTFHPYTDQKALMQSLHEQFLSLQISHRTIAAAVNEVKVGTSTGSTLRLAPTGVLPGTYKNASLTIGADGRVLSIQELPDPATELPPVPGTGLVLKTTASGLAWVPETAVLPADGTTGQVLGRTASGVAWVDVAEPDTPDSIVVLASSTIDVTMPNDTSYVPALRRSGVTPGSYTSPNLTVDEFGRVLSINDGGNVPVPMAYSSHMAGGTSALWRLLCPRRFSQPDFDSTVEFLVDGDWISGTQTRTADSVQATFASPVEVTGVRVTAATADGALSSGSVGNSDTGALWSPAFDLPDQPAWAAGESRVFTLAPAITLEGDVTGTGGTEVHTVLSPTGATAGIYTNPTIQIDTKGRILHAENGVATGGSGSVNADTPLDYLTFKSPDGALWQVSIANGGTWATTVANVLITENGEMITTQNGEAIGF